MKKNINIAVIGLGYVGLPLAIEFGKYFSTVGYDIDKKKILNLLKFIDTNKELSKIEIKKSKKLIFTSKIKDIKLCNYYIICVPTPINKNKKPDLKLIESAAKIVSKVIKNGDVVVIESTVFPGVTEKICKNIIEKKAKLKIITEKNKKGFHIGYSPERLNPGDKNRKLHNITKVISGNTPESLKIIKNIYSIVQKNNIYEASSIEVAEAAKVIENVQRDVNIALINELTKIFNKSKIDIFEVLKTASTKWNFHQYFPGLVGGHCIGVDPYYLSYYSKIQNINPLIITSGRKINDQMYKYLVKKIIDNLKINNLYKKNTKLLIMGYSFKKNCSDIRNTQIERVFNSLYRYFKNINIYDPLIDKSLLKPKIKNKFITYPKVNFYDSIIIAVNHDIFRKIGEQKIIKLIKNDKKIVFDINNYFKNSNFIHF